MFQLTGDKLVTVHLITANNDVFCKSRTWPYFFGLLFDNFQMLLTILNEQLNNFRLSLIA